MATPLPQRRRPSWLPATKPHLNWRGLLSGVPSAPEIRGRFFSPFDLRPRGPGKAHSSTSPKRLAPLKFSSEASIATGISGSAKITCGLSPTFPPGAAQCLSTNINARNANRATSRSCVARATASPAPSAEAPGKRCSSPYSAVRGTLIPAVRLRHPRARLRILPVPVVDAAALHPPAVVISLDLLRAGITELQHPG